MIFHVQKNKTLHTEKKCTQELWYVNHLNENNQNLVAAIDKQQSAACDVTVRQLTASVTNVLRQTEWNL